ncbi:MAG: hypothetical protein H6709_07685 [Kofleriaceae bacterium]|nr:hypothetical protein [Kofleriaceae bacterium]
MRAPRVIVLALAAALAAPACGGRHHALDVSALVAELGDAGAAEALRVRIAADPRDVAARRALLALEDRLGHPGEVLAQLEAIHALGGLLDDGLARGERARLAALYRTRAAGRADRGWACALDDVDRARRGPGARRRRRRGRARDPRHGGGGPGRPPSQRSRAARPRRPPPGRGRRSPGRRAGRRAGAGRRGAGGAGRGAPAQLAAAGLTLWRRGVRRVAGDVLDRWERTVAAAVAHGESPAIDGAVADAWLAARAWWHGRDGRPDPASLDRAIAAGASPCHFARAAGDDGCSAAASVAAGDDGAPWEPALVATAAARGWRTDDPVEAAAWVVVTLRAARRGDVGSWLDAVDARVALAALRLRAGDAGAGAAVRIPDALPGWARPTLWRAASRADRAAVALDAALGARDRLPAAARAVVAIEAALAGHGGDDAASPPPPPAGDAIDPDDDAAVLGHAAARLAGDPARADDLVAVAWGVAPRRRGLGSGRRRARPRRRRRRRRGAGAGHAVRAARRSGARPRLVGARRRGVPGEPSLLAGLVAALADDGDGARPRGCS